MVGRKEGNLIIYFIFLRLKKAEVEQGQTNVIDWGADCFPLAGMHVILLSVSVRHHDNHLCVLASGNAAASCPCKQHSTLTLTTAQETQKDIISKVENTVIHIGHYTTKIKLQKLDYCKNFDFCPTTTLSL